MHCPVADRDDISEGGLHWGAEHFTFYQLVYKLIEAEEPSLKLDSIFKRDTSQLRFELHTKLCCCKNVIHSHELVTADLPWGLFCCRFHSFFSEDIS